MNETTFHRIQFRQISFYAYENSMKPSDSAEHHDETRARAIITVTKARIEIQRPVGALEQRSLARKDQAGGITSHEVNTGHKCLKVGSERERENICNGAFRGVLQLAVDVIL